METPLQDHRDPETPRRIRTAEALGRYYRELIEEGFDADFARTLVERAADKLQHDAGLGVKP